MQKFAMRVSQEYRVDEKISHEDMLEFYRIILPYYELAKEKLDGVVGMKNQLEKALGLRIIKSK